MAATWTTGRAGLPHVRLLDEAKAGCPLAATGAACFLRDDLPPDSADGHYSAAVSACPAARDFRSSIFRNVFYSFFCTLYKLLDTVQHRVFLARQF